MGFSRTRKDFFRVYFCSVENTFQYQLFPSISKFTFHQIYNNQLLMNVELKQQIINAFEKTLVPSKNSIEQGSALLTQLKAIQGCCLMFMEIIDDANGKDQIRQAAAIQLKLNIESRWKSTKALALTDNEKNMIRQFLLPAFLRSHRNTKILPIYRVIVKTIVENDFKVWLPANDAILQIQKDPSTIPGCMYFLEAIFNGVTNLIEEERQYTQNLIQSIFPQLYEIMKVSNSLEVVYLVSKIFWRGYKNSIKEKAMNQSFKFMPIIKHIIQYQDPNLSPLCNGKIQKSTLQFFYFHSKKWACRLLWKFYQSHANSVFHQTNQTFSNQWFKQFGQSFVEVLVNQLPIPCIKKAKFFQIKALVAVTNFKYDMIDPFVQKLLFELLIPFILLTQNQEEQAKQQPLEYLRAEEDPIQNFSNTKSVATDLWVELSGTTAQNRGTRSKGKKSTPPTNKYLMQSMQFLKKNLEQGDMIHKEMAMYLLCKMHRVLIDIKQIQQALPILIKTYVLPHFQNEIMLLRARAAQLFSEYGHIEFKDQSILRDAVQGIYKLMTTDTNPVVKLKAAYAFNCVLRHKTSVEMVKPYLNQILNSYVGLLNQYETQSLVNSLQGIVAQFSEQIGVFAVRLVSHLSNIFARYCGIVQNQNDENTLNDVQLAAGGCIDTIKRIIDSPLTLEVLKELQPFLISVIQLGFTREGSDNCNDMLYLLASYINKIDVISKDMWFFYPCIFYLSIGINKDIPNISQYSQLQQKIFQYLQEEPNAEIFNEGMPAIRAYIYKGINILSTQNDFFGTNLFMLIFKAADKLYEGHPQDQLKATITALMIYILQNVKQSEQLIPLMWQVIKRNMIQNSFRYLRVINGQLACMCMYVAPEQFFASVQLQNSVGKIFDYIFHPDSLYLNEWQKQRIVLGLSRVLTLRVRSQALNSEYPRIMDNLKKHISEIYGLRKERINDSDQQTSSDGGENDENQDSYNLMDDCYWQQPRDDDFKTALDCVDEIGYFEVCLNGLRQQQSNVYNELMSRYSADDLQHLNEAVVKSKQQFSNRRKQIEQNLSEMRSKGIAY